MTHKNGLKQVREIGNFQFIQRQLFLQDILPDAIRIKGMLEKGERLQKYPLMIKDNDTQTENNQ